MAVMVQPQKITRWPLPPHAVTSSVTAHKVKAFAHFYKWIVAALPHQPSLTGGNMRGLTSCSSTGNPTPMGNAIASKSPAYGPWLCLGAIKVRELVDNRAVEEEDEFVFSWLRVEEREQRKERMGKWMSDCCNLFRRNIPPPCLFLCVRKSEAQRAERERVRSQMLR